jgi:hypothetical protein
VWIDHNTRNANSGNTLGTCGSKLVSIFKIYSDIHLMSDNGVAMFSDSISKITRV